MKNSIFTILSFALIILLSYYILNFREGIILSVWLFWFSIIGIFSLITYQIQHLEKFSNNHYILILMQILITASLIRLLFISPENVLIGYDSYNEYISLLEINQNNYWNPDLLKGLAPNYPVLYIFGIVFSNIVGISLFYTVKWFPLAIFYLGPVFIFLIGNIKYSKKAGLFSALGFSFIYISLFFHSSFQRETIAIIFMLISFYCYLRSVYIQENKIIFIILSIFIMSMLVLTHHLTSFIYLVFLSTLLVIELISRRSILRNYIKNENISITFILLLLTMLFGYWAYLKYTPLEIFGLIIKESAVTDPGAGLILPQSLRYNLLYYSEIIFSVVFGIIAFISILLLKTTRKSSDVALFVFSGFTGVIMVMTLFGALLKSESMGLGSRMQTFVYIGLFLLSGYFFAKMSINKPNSLNKNNFVNFIKKIAPIILIIFLVINIYRIPPYLYSDYTFSAEEPRSVISGQELDAIVWLGVGFESIIADKNLRGPIKLGKFYSTTKSGYGLTNITKYDSIYVFHNTIAPFTTENYTSNDKLYDNGISSIFLTAKPQNL